MRYAAKRVADLDMPEIYLYCKRNSTSSVNSSNNFVKYLSSIYYFTVIAVYEYALRVDPFGDEVGGGLELGQQVGVRHVGDSNLHHGLQLLQINNNYYDIKSLLNI